VNTAIILYYSRTRKEYMLQIVSENSPNWEDTFSRRSQS